MSSGNTYGLGEISHFGAFQRVGGKAGGFINKKFFHPSNLRNQEKLWMAMTEDEREQRKQGELQKRRDEERQVEDLRKQMYLSGQGKASDISAAVAQEMTDAQKLSFLEKADQKAAVDEQKRRRHLLKKAAARREAAEAKAEAKASRIQDGLPEGSPEESPEGSPEESSDEENGGNQVAGGSAVERVLARSKYEEDVHVRGHRSVWGSWYSGDPDKQWGFACCKIRDVSEQCPLEPVNEEEEAAAKVESKGQKRRRKGREGKEAAEAGEPAENEPAAPQGGLVGGATASFTAAPIDPATGERVLIDQRLLQAGERRQEKRKLEEMKKEEKTSGYLADLLSDPTAG